jgi:hypothetical protein
MWYIMLSMTRNVNRGLQIGTQLAAWLNHQRQAYERLRDRGQVLKPAGYEWRRNQKPRYGRAHYESVRRKDMRLALHNHPYNLLTQLIKYPDTATHVKAGKKRPIDERRVRSILWDHQGKLWLSPQLELVAKSGPHSYDAGMILLYALIQTGYAANVTECRWCKRWFFARRAGDDRSCSSKCRENYARKSPEKREQWRRGRALYMRKTYRPRQKAKLEARSKRRKS